MRFLSVLICSLFLCMSLVSCEKEKNDTSEEIIQSTGVIQNQETHMTEEKEPLKITEDYLLPLEDYSWEREFAPEMVVIHFTSNVVAERQNPHSIQAVKGIFEQTGVSINYIIDREGQIFCFIPESRAAWHAGKGNYGGTPKYTNALNKYSVGIEMLAIGSQEEMSQYLHKEEYDALDKSLIGYTEAQYDSLSKLVFDICTRNNISPDRQHIIGHDEYNPNKTDPGELFDWEKLFEKLNTLDQ